MEVVIDSHALFWYLEEPKKLPTKIITLLDSADLVVIPTIVLLELEYILAKKGFLGRFEELLSELIENKTFSIHPLNTTVVKKYSSVTPNLEMHDRVILTTALLLKVPILSKDPEIAKVYPRIIW